MVENTAIVIDLGSKDIKAGYVYGWPSEEEPRLVTPAAATLAEDPQPVHALHCGEIVDWRVLESLLYYSLYTQLGWVEGAEGSCLMVEPALTSRRDRELLTQVMFEVFNVSGYFATDSGVASLAAVGKLSGLVVDMGYEKTDILPVLEGCLQPSGATRLPYGGQQLTAHMQHLLQQRGITVSHEVAEKIKPAAMRLDSSTPEPTAEEEKEKHLSSSYTLPDGQVIDVEAEGRAVGEAALLPSLLGLTLPSLAQTIHTAGLITTIQGEKEARKALAENILLCGGSAAVPGLSQRVLAEVAALAHPALPPGLVHIPDYMPKKTVQRASWVGGAVLAKVVFAAVGPTQLQQAVTKADYDEMGPSVIHRKCS